LCPEIWNFRYINYAIPTIDEFGVPDGGMAGLRQIRGNNQLDLNFFSLEPLPSSKRLIGARAKTLALSFASINRRDIHPRNRDGRYDQFEKAPWQ
jgi:hypothetical protein